MLLLMQGCTQMAGHSSPEWPFREPASQEQEWMAARMAELGTHSSIKPAAAANVMALQTCSIYEALTWIAIT